MKLEIQKRLAENLKRLRKERKLTQFELAEVLEVDVLKFFIPADTQGYVDNTLFCELKDIVTRHYNTYLRNMMVELEIKS